MPATIIDGRKLSNEVVATAIEKASHLPRRPGLGVIIVGDDPASHIYVRGKKRRAEEAGFLTEIIYLPADTTEHAVLEAVESLNHRNDIDGVLVQLPLPDPISTLRVMAAVDPAKDVDGLHTINAGHLAQGSDGLIPCTPLGCMTIIKSILPDLTGAHAVVIGNSNIVGKPMASLLLAEWATVVQTHIHTRDIEAICQTADVLVTAVGKPGLVRGSWIRPGSVVIDVGTTRVLGPDGKFHVRGDVAFEEALPIAGAITPVPGGVGPMTIACLLSNTVKASTHRQAHHH
ncbi:MAG: tetrahydrofolate dehydrogenase/cyclohydrolase catalytic domain-containing protein [Acidobacteriaceae bacterium]